MSRRNYFYSKDNNPFRRLKKRCDKCKRKGKIVGISMNRYFCESCWLSRAEECSNDK